MTWIENVAGHGALDPEWLFKIRVAVARHGEMDRAKWWNTTKALSNVGAMVLKRGLPRTYPFAQARSVMAVARYRCEQHFNPPKSVTLWQLPEPVEDSIEAAWEGWLGDAPGWSGFFDAVSGGTEPTVTAFLKRLGLVSEQDVAASAKLKRSTEGRSVALPGYFGGSAAEVALLALGFDLSGGGLVIPYARLAT